MTRDNRFEIVYKEGSSLNNNGIKKILVDKQTGVNYLFLQSGYGSSITPLLNPDGQPIVTRLY